ncbi:MAG TPA: hypothetical protein VNN21_00410 [Dehalococcoidia bacterium]|nr:hypothetical protein [Dehalococcoidia bacterium]
MDLLLVGEDSLFLRLLASELRAAGVHVRVANDAQALREALVEARPDVVVFDHVEPMDLFVLNPRDSGFEGPLVLLVEENAPVHVLEAFGFREVIWKPVRPKIIIERVTALLSA